MYITTQQKKIVTPFGTFERTYDAAEEMENIANGDDQEEVNLRNADITFKPRGSDLPELRRFSAHTRWKLTKYLDEDSLMSAQLSFGLLKGALAYAKLTVI